MTPTPLPADGADATVRPARGIAAGTSRVLALASLIGLIALCLSWELWLAPTGSGRLAIKVLPLLLCVSGLLRDRLYTYRVLSLTVWLYVVEGSVRAYTERGLSAQLATAELVLCLLLFTACALHVRWPLQPAAPAR